MKKTLLLFALILLSNIQLYSQFNYLQSNSLMSVPDNNYPLATLKIRNGLPNFFEKIKDGDNITIAYLGGSITNHNGYRKYNEEWFKSEYPKTCFNFINAGIGGTGSDLGVFRLKDDVLKHNPDLIFVEFAVNDGNGDSLKISNSMEGIVRQIKRNNPKTDICFLYTINTPMIKDMEKGRLFKSVRLSERIAEHYSIPSINLGVEVIKMMMDDQLVFTGKKDVDYGNKIVFTNDNTHPTFDQGHKLYNEIIIKSLIEIKNNQSKNNKKLPKPLYKSNYEYASMINPTSLDKTKGWETIDNTHPLYKMNKDRCPELIFTSNNDDSLTFKFKGNAIGIYDIIGPNSCGFTIQIDDQKPMDIQRFDIYCHYYRNNYILLPPIDNGVHSVVIRKMNKTIDKEQIVSKRFADKITEKTRQEFNDNILYIGKIMIIGEIIE